MASNRELSIILTLQDKASKELQSVEKNFDKALSDIGKAFTVAGGAISSFGFLATKASLESESAQRRLATILRTTNDATDEQINSLFEQARALEKVGVVSEDVAMVAQGQLATFDLQVDTIKALTPAILDYAVAEKGVAVSTAEVQAMTNGLAQALQGNFASLTKTGFVLDEHTKKMIAEGTETERVTALVSVLDSTYKDHNKTMRETAEGGIQVMKNEFNELQKVIGDNLLPILKKFTEAITPVITKVSDWIQKNPELATKIILITSAVGGLMLVLGPLLMILPGLVTLFSAVGVVLGAITLPAILMAGAIALLIASGWLLYQNWEAVKNLAIEVWAFISEAVIGYVNKIKEVVSNILGNIKEVFISSWVAIKEAIDIVLSAISGVFTFYISLLTGLIVTFLDWLIPDWREKLQTLLTTAQEIWTSLSEWFKLTWEGIKIMWLEFTTLLSNTWSSFWSFITTTITPFINAIKEKILSLWTWIKETYTKLSEPVKEIWGNFWASAKNATTEAWEGIKIVVKESINWIIGKINKFIQATNKIALKGASVLGISIPTLPEIPMLAKGGIVTKPTLAMVGEAGPEAVVPLNKAGGFGGITIIVNGDVSGQDLINKVAEGLMNKLALNNRITI